jgi:hypothetical protein
MHRNMQDLLESYWAATEVLATASERLSTAEAGSAEADDRLREVARAFRAVRHCRRELGESAGEEVLQALQRARLPVT